MYKDISRNKSENKEKSKVLSLYFLNHTHKLYDATIHNVTT